MLQVNADDKRILIWKGKQSWRENLHVSRTCNSLITVCKQRAAAEKNSAVSKKRILHASALSLCIYIYELFRNNAPFKTWKFIMMSNICQTWKFI